MNVISAFTGIGGFDLGFERAGINIVAQIEIDTACQKVLKHHWPEVVLKGDIQGVKTKSLPEAEILCGGFPCQDLSKAGLRAGLSGTRSSLFYEFYRLAEEARPQWIIIENVPGLLSSNRGRDMGTILGLLAQLGYRLAWRILDAQYFGLAQRRKRLFIVGCLGGLKSATKVLFEPESLSRDFASPPATQRRNQNRLALAPFSYVRRESKRLTKAVYAPPLASTLLTHPGRNNVDQTWIIEVRNGKRFSIKVRQLSCTESERVQGFPDGWTDMLAYSPRLRVLGNAVPVSVTEWIGTRIVAVENKK